MKNDLMLKKKLNRLLFENLPEDKRIEFEIMLKVGDKRRIQEFIRSILPDIENILDKNLKALI